MDETGALHDRRLRSFVVTETSPDERETCCIVVAVYTPLYSHVGACTWPRSTCQWDLLPCAAEESIGFFTTTAEGWPGTTLS